MKKSVKKSGSPDNNGAVENLEKAFKHGMCLRSRSGSVSPNKKPGFKKKASAPPVIIRPASSARSSGGMILVIRGKLTKKQREEEMGRYVQYRAARRIADAGFTPREYSLCRSYLVKRDYEFMDPVPEKFKYCEAFINQIRRTRGYGLTMSPPRGLGLVGRSFVAYLSQWKKERVVKVYVEKMIQMVLAELEMRIPGKKYHRDGKQIENLVVSDWTHLLSFRVHQGAPTDPPEIVEAFFFAPPLGPIVKHLDLQEWKIRQGSEVIFCTEKIWQ